MRICSTKRVFRYAMLCSSICLIYLSYTTFKISILKLLTGPNIIDLTVWGSSVSKSHDRNITKFQVLGTPFTRSHDRHIFYSTRTHGNDLLLANGTVEPTMACVHPKLNFKFEYKPVPPVQCNDNPDWTVVSNGSFWVTDYALKTHKRVICQYSSIIRKDEDHVTFGKTMPFATDVKVPAPSDFFRVACKSSNGHFYNNVHATVTSKTNVKLSPTISIDSKKLNVLMFGFDTVSAVAWRTFLPKSHKYFTDKLSGTLLEGYNIVGDGTPQALLPILTGQSETDLPETRRGFPDSQYVDIYPWIWKEYERAGYVTQWGEDMAHIGTFNHRMKGFNESPVHHYMRPYFLYTEKLHFRQKQFCYGALPRHKVMMNWVQDAFTYYQCRPKFIYAFHSEYSHGDYQQVQVADDDLVTLLSYLHDNGHLNRTVLILMSDHGPRFLAERRTLQGKLEERMPYVGFAFPPWFKVKYPLLYNNFINNRNKLTTPFEIHKTMMHILKLSTNHQYSSFESFGRTNMHYSLFGRLKKKNSHYGLFERPKEKNINHSLFERPKQNNIHYSLFEEIPLSRTCSDAKISPHWCACVQWRELGNSRSLISKAISNIEQEFNSWTSKYRSKCSILKVAKVHTSMIAEFDNKMINFVKSSDKHGRVPQYSNTSITHNKIQIVFTTDPGGGEFEVTMDYKSTENNSTFSLDMKDVSRVNRYGQHADCISKVAPHLRQYCFCISS